MYSGIKREDAELLFGDSYTNFSEFTLSNAIKGGKLTLGKEGTSRLILLSGIDTSRWEDLWEERQEDSATRRFVWGSRLENKLLDNKLDLNFSYAGARDDIAYTAATAAPIMVNVFGIDAKYKINKYFTANGEFAQSFTDENIRLDETKTKSDQAFKAGFDFNSTSYSLTQYYSRVGKHFNSTGGFTAQDLETLSFDGLLFMPWKIKFGHYLKIDRDNLSKTLSTTTKQINPGGKLNFELPFKTAGDIGFDYRKRFSVDKTVNEKTYTYSTGLGRDFEILYARLGYIRTNVVNKVTPAQERYADNFSLSLDGNFSLKDIKFSWNVAENIINTKYLEARKADFNTGTDLGLKMVFPSSLAFQGKISLLDNDYYINSTDSENRNYYFAVSRNLMKDNLSFEVSYERKAYRYFSGDNNYADNLLRAKFDYKF